MSKPSEFNYHENPRMSDEFINQSCKEIKGYRNFDAYETGHAHGMMKSRDFYEPLLDSECIAFGEWIFLNNYFMRPTTKDWYRPQDTDKRYLSTAELLSIYRNKIKS